MPFDPDPEPKWYVVFTETGVEAGVATALREQATALGLADAAADVVGPPVTTERQAFTGAVMVRMAMREAAHGLVRNTPGVKGFKGDPDPQPLSELEAQGLIKIIESGALPPRFEAGRSMRVVGGPFTGFSGVIDEVDWDQSKLQVTVSIFGRPTPLTLRFDDVEMAYRSS